MCIKRIKYDSLCGEKYTSHKCLVMKLSFQWYHAFTSCAINTVTIQTTCICFPVNYKEPTPRHSLQLWKECGQRNCKALNGYRSLNVANGLGRIRDSSCRDCLSQSEAYPPLSLGRSTVKPGV